MRATTELYMAERVGFEPTNTGEDVTGIPVQRLRPLGHLSDQSLTPALRERVEADASPSARAANDKRCGCGLHRGDAHAFGVFVGWVTL